MLNYSFTDEHPDAGLNYYRLKQTDFNGDYYFSNVITLNFEKETQFNISYNYSANEIVISTTAHNSNDITIELIDLTGRVNYKTTTANSTTIINTENLVKGIYLLKISGDNTIFNNKVIIY